jgi:hypothetical protein
MVKRTDPKTGRKYEATSRKGKEIWEQMKKKKARAAKREANKKAQGKCLSGKCVGGKCGGKTATVSQLNKLKPIKAVKNGGVRLSASWYYNFACDGKLSRCEPQMIRQPSGQYKLKKIRIVEGQSGPEPRWVNA